MNELNRDPQEIKNSILRLLDLNNVQYNIFQHAPILFYEEAKKAQKQYGWTGTEGKTLVLKADDTFIVYFTIQGQKVNFDVIKTTISSKKVRLATPEELQEYFGAVPGCVYPFGFNKTYTIYVDPAIYEQAWMVFSPCLPTYTVQVKGSDLKKVFCALQNKVIETNEFNL